MSNVQHQGASSMGRNLPSGIHSPQQQFQNDPSRGPRMEKMNFDKLADLPVDDVAPSPKEVHLVDSLFKQQPSIVKKVTAEIKDIVVVIALFMLFSLPPVIRLMEGWFTIMQTSPYINIMIRALLFTATFWTIKHLYLSRNRKQD